MAAVEVAAVQHALATVQAVRLRVAGNGATVIPAPLRRFIDDVAATSGFVEEDRALEHELRALTARIAAGEFADARSGAAA